MSGIAQLTWHPGSIPPYASLWHTLRRVACLNRLRMMDLGRLVPAVSVRHGPVPDLLHNDDDAIDTQALERLLGEAPQALAWSHMGRAAPWMRFLFTPGMRVCPACLADGYHSALLSLRLLGACPIHGLPLRSHCHCGRGFSARFTARDCLSAACCPCGRFVFFTSETCRRPTLRPGATMALDPAVRWLRQCARIAMLQHPDQAQQHDGDATWLRSICVWCSALDIDYPECFLQPPAQPAYTARVCKGRAAARPTKHGTRTAKPPERSLDATPLRLVYRAMARHLRRHVVVGRSKRWVTKFMQSGNVLEIARMLAGQPRAVLSLAELMWARQVEEHVEERRWPYRQMPTEQPMRVLRDQQLAFDPAGQARSVYAQIDESQRRWLDEHAAAWVLSTLWSHALSRAVMMAYTGVADWERNCCSTLALCTGAATIDADSRACFVGIAAAGTVMGVPPRPDKLQRRHMVTQAQDTVLRACQGPCLTWSDRDGWFVAPSRSPAHGAFKRHRLLGIAQARPHFWLFTSADGIVVARHCQVAMQALGNTPAQAMEALRAAVRNHIKVYGSADHEPRRHVMPVTPRPVELSGTQRLHEEMLRIRERRGFWSASSWLITEFFLNDAGLNISAARHHERESLFAWVDAAVRQSPRHPWNVRA